MFSFKCPDPPKDKTKTVVEVTEHKEELSRKILHGKYSVSLDKDSITFYRVAGMYTPHYSPITFHFEEWPEFFQDLELLVEAFNKRVEK